MLVCCDADVVMRSPHRLFRFRDIGAPAAGDCNAVFGFTCCIPMADDDCCSSSCSLFGVIEEIHEI